MSKDGAAKASPAVSVIVPTYNRGRLIARALDSVLRQYRPGDEVIVVDDGSTDGTEGVIARYGERVRYLRAGHRGAGPARNIGIDEARNPLIAFLDSDDEWVDGKLDLQRALLENRPDVLFCFGDLGYRYESGGERHGMLAVESPGVEQVLGAAKPFSSIAALPAGAPDVPVRIGCLYAGQMEKNFVQLDTLVYRKDAAGSVRFPEDLRTREDWEFAGRLARAGLAAYLDWDVAWLYKHSGPQLTKLPYVIYLEDRLKLLERTWGGNEEFLSKHNDDYQQIRYDLYWTMIREWLCRGERERAQAELARVANVPLHFRLLARQPAAINRIAFRLRDAVRGEGRTSSRETTSAA